MPRGARSVSAIEPNDVRCRVRCPRCPDASLDTTDVPTCPRCRGSWLSVAELRKRVGHAQHRWRPTLDWQLEQRDTLACVACGHAMVTLRLFDVAVERCDEHGVWLDRDDLDAIVAKAGANTSDAGRTLLDAAVDIFWMWG
jgi:Zn-finger nucleic acid-binding protein